MFGLDDKIIIEIKNKYLKEFETLSNLDINFK